MPTYNNWGVKYSTITFFERALRSHNQVKLFNRFGDIFFHLNLTNGNEIGVLLVEEYTLGLAAIHRATDEFQNVRHIVTGGSWNGYTREAKEYGIKNDIGIFVIDEFLGALHSSKPVKYVKKMRRKSQSIITGMPDGSTAFVFGSVFRTTCPKDLDLLIVYDPSLCPPDNAYRAHVPITVRLRQEFGLPVDMTLLTYDEERSSHFIEVTGAFPIAVLGKHNAAYRILEGKGLSRRCERRAFTARPATVRSTKTSSSSTPSSRAHFEPFTPTRN